MNNNIKYRQLVAGEIIIETDEYISVFSCGEYIPVDPITIGKEILPCNCKYYRRAVK